MKEDLIGMCGAYCGACEWKEKTNCPGCQKARSQMFWGQCSVAKCALEKGLKHCGTCKNLPCSTLKQAFDDPDNGDNGERLANLKGWAEGKETYLEIKK